MPRPHVHLHFRTEEAASHRRTHRSRSNHRDARGRLIDVTCIRHFLVPFIRLRFDHLRRVTWPSLAKSSSAREATPVSKPNSGPPKSANAAVPTAPESTGATRVDAHSPA